MLLHLLLSVCILPPVSMTVYFKVKIYQYTSEAKLSEFDLDVSRMSV